MLFFLMLVGLAHCASEPYKVVERADDLSDRPAWASWTKVSAAVEGKRYFIGYVELSGDASKAAALNLSDLKALLEPYRTLFPDWKDRTSALEDPLNGIQGARSLEWVSLTREGIALPSMVISDRYWEILQDKDEPTRRILRAYSRVSVLESDWLHFRNAQSHPADFKP